MFESRRTLLFTEPREVHLADRTCWVSLYLHSWRPRQHADDLVRLGKEARQLPVGEQLEKHRATGQPGSRPVGRGVQEAEALAAPCAHDMEEWGCRPERSEVRIH